MDWRGNDMRHKSAGRGMLRLTLVLLIAGAPMAAATALPDSLCIQGVSMKPTLEPGLCYALRDTTGGIKRGDVVWFWRYVKEVTAVEGDTVNGHVVKPKRVWVSAEHGSFDSRYIGTIPRHEIKAILVVSRSQEELEQ